MKNCIRTGLVFIILTAGSGGCSGQGTTIVDRPIERPAPVYTTPSVPAVPAPTPYILSPTSVDDYKSRVAHHVIEHNRELYFTGTLPPLMPAIVVLRITVDRAGQIINAEVQRSRDPDASQVALDSLWRSAPLPAPQWLAVQAGGTLTYMETFLFGERYRYQLRSLEPLQASK
jgi:protein TonB